MCFILCVDHVFGGSGLDGVVLYGYPDIFTQTCYTMNMPDWASAKPDYLGSAMTDDCGFCHATSG